MTILNERILKIPLLLICFFSCAGLLSVCSASPLAGQNSQANNPQGVLQSFDYRDVTLTGGPIEAQAKAAREFYLAISEDNLLHGFRVRAGLPAPGKDMGGWYDPENFAGAHPFGQFISALARIYANTGDVRFKDKAARLVHGFHETFGADGFFYSSQKAFRDWGCYIYDKNCIGMRDAYTLTGNTEALAVLSKMTDWAVTRLPRRNDEWYTLPENLYQCYELTHEARYLKMAQEYDYSKDYYDVFAAGKNAFLPTRHAYSHVNTLCSAARAYEVTQDEKYLRTIVNAWDFLTGTQMYATGGWGPNERFVPVGVGALPMSLNRTGANFETPCGSYANINLDRYLLHYTGAAKYGDNIERLLFNGMLATLPMQPDGRTFYYSNYRPNTHKGYFSSLWPCCSGTYAQVTADYPLNIYFHDAKGLTVNLFTPSRVRWQRPQGAVSVEQATEYPNSNTTTLTVRCARRERFSLRVRVPGWIKPAPGQNVKVKLNGRDWKLDVRPGTFLNLDRTWRNGDAVVVTFPMSLRFEPIDEATPQCAALLYGPTLLVATDNAAPGVVKTGTSDTFVANDQAHPAAWIHPVPGQSLAFKTEGGKHLFRPFYQIQDEEYTAYQWFSAPELAPPGERIVDKVAIGDAASEKEHNLLTERSNTGPILSTHWRDAAGKFSYVLAVDAERENTLWVRYWGDETPPRTFDILVNDQLLSTTSLNHDKPDKPNTLFWRAYAIPLAQTQDKTQVRITFQAHPGNTAGGVMGLAIGVK